MTQLRGSNGGWSKRWTYASSPSNISPDHPDLSVSFLLFDQSNSSVPKHSSPPPFRALPGEAQPVANPFHRRRCQKGPDQSPAVMGTDHRWRAAQEAASVGLRPSQEAVLGPEVVALLGRPNLFGRSGK